MFLLAMMSIAAILQCPTQGWLAAKPSERDLDVVTKLREEAPWLPTRSQYGFDHRCPAAAVYLHAYCPRPILTRIQAGWGLAQRRAYQHNILVEVSFVILQPFFAV